MLFICNKKPKAKHQGAEIFLLKCGSVGLFFPLLFYIFSWTTKILSFSWEKQTNKHRVAMSLSSTQIIRLIVTRLVRTLLSVGWPRRIPLFRTQKLDLDIGKGNEHHAWWMRSLLDKNSSLIRIYQADRDRTDMILSTAFNRWRVVFISTVLEKQHRPLARNWHGFVGPRW